MGDEIKNINRNRNSGYEVNKQFLDSTKLINPFRINKNNSFHAQMHGKPLPIPVR
jgi:hypothetical protein